MTAKPDITLELNVDENVVQLDLKTHSPTFYHFTDEYDMQIIDIIAEETGFSSSEIILKGLFLELQELGVIVSYESEKEIKNQIEEFCNLVV